MIRIEDLEERAFPFIAEFENMKLMVSSSTDHLHGNYIAIDLEEGAVEYLGYWFGVEFTKHGVFIHNGTTEIKETTR